ncbi:hypothetical protein [Flavilitoribacter nigricans]|uniref:Lipocalin-like domain-containing protein n=1 Tax=Flavilitoribacter nigricans (strain ATCC 23147 / DSM 23189 / NBRC 102662 / NCIMB 1420 / SS-2) TaxID=1122177 RepID=A0A2D0NA40_FLAN2|nr:hypothetical protein [Flavilitoribacter nigricans]PHN05029.1 hypothetical protein CRP01_18560 [Flavilitoribacter nigricans DSM 23189 = NBRC 102662]
MHRNQRAWLGLLLLIVFLPACQEETALPYSIEGAYNCYQDETWTLESVDDALIGEWDHVYYSCYSGEMEEIPVGDLRLVFKENHELEIYRDGLLDRQDTWEVIPRGSENFALTTSQIQPWLNGDIVICEDLLVFFESYIDGCDNYFERR